MGLKERISEVSIFVYLLIVGFSISAWIDMTGVFQEMPLLLTELPEGWELPSITMMLLQVSKLSTVLYVVAQRCAPDKVKEMPVVFGVIALDAVGCLFLAFLWNELTMIGGSLHSVAFLAICSILMLADNVTPVTYIPYMASLKPQYLSAYFFGEGVSQLVPAVIAIAQGVGNIVTCTNTTIISFNETTGENTTEFGIIPQFNEPRFSARVYFILLALCCCFAGGCFALLHFLPYSIRVAHLPKDEKDKKDSISESSDKGNDEEDKTLLKDEKSCDIPPDDGIVNEKAIIAYECECCRDVTEPIWVKNEDKISLNVKKPCKNKAGHEEIQTVKEKGCTREKLEFAYIIFIYGLLCVLWIGIISLLPYSCLPHGNMAYSLAMNIGAVAHAMAGFLALFVVVKSFIWIGVLTLVGSALSILHMYLAYMSPNPPLKGETGGVVLVVLTYPALTACFAYARACLSSITQDERGHTGLLWIAVVQQVGVTIGGIVPYLIISVFHLLEAEMPCSS